MKCENFGCDSHSEEIKGCPKCGMLLCKDCFDEHAGKCTGPVENDNEDDFGDDLEL